MSYNWTKNKSEKFNQIKPKGYDVGNASYKSLGKHLKEFSTPKDI